MATIRKRGSKWYVQPWNRRLKKREPEEPLPLSIKTKRDAKRAGSEIQENLDRQSLGLPLVSWRSSGKGTWLEVAMEVLAETEISARGDWLELSQSPPIDCDSSSASASSGSRQVQLP